MTDHSIEKSSTTTFKFKSKTLKKNYFEIRICNDNLKAEFAMTTDYFDLFDTDFLRFVLLHSVLILKSLKTWKNFKDVDFNVFNFTTKIKWIQKKFWKTLIDDFVTTSEIQHFTFFLSMNYVFIQRNYLFWIVTMKIVFNNDSIFWTNLSIWDSLLLNRFNENWNRAYEFFRCYYRFHSNEKKKNVKELKQTMSKVAQHLIFLIDENLVEIFINETAFFQTTILNDFLQQKNIMNLTKSESEIVSFVILIDTVFEKIFDRIFVNLSFIDQKNIRSKLNDETKAFLIIHIDQKTRILYSNEKNSVNFETISNMLNNARFEEILRNSNKISEIDRMKFWKLQKKKNKVIVNASSHFANCKFLELNSINSAIESIVLHSWQTIKTAWFRVMKQSTLKSALFADDIDLNKTITVLNHIELSTNSINQNVFIQIDCSHDANFVAQTNLKNSNFNSIWSYIIVNSDWLQSFEH